ncbi:hypothetical protein MMPV_007199 [Pyropia vietnamensis]
MPSAATSAATRCRRRAVAVRRAMARSWRAMGPARQLVAAVAATSAVLATCVYLLRPAVSAADADVAAVVRVAKKAGASTATEATAAAMSSRAGEVSPFDVTALTDTYPPPEDLAAFATAAVRYLVRASQPDGTFVYEVRVAPNGQVSRPRGYNTLRHAGAIYALGDACLGRGGLPARSCVGANETMARACEWLLRVAVRSVPGGEADAGVPLLGVWSKPRVELGDLSRPEEELGDVRLGGLGLGLVALTTCARLDSPAIAAATDGDAVAGGVPAAVVDGLTATLMLRMQKPDGGFFSYMDAAGVPNDHRVSLYYPGEAVLGLLMAYALRGNARLLVAAVRGLEALAASRADMKPADFPCDHWTLIATAVLFRTPAFRVVWEHGRRPRRKRAAVLLAAARSLTTSCYERDVRRTPRSTGSPCSLATGLEGTFAMLPLLARVAGYDPAGAPTAMDEELLHNGYCLGQRTVGELVASQVRGLPPGSATATSAAAAATEAAAKSVAGALPGRVDLTPVDPDKAGNARRVVSGSDGVYRVDTTQHSLSAVLAYVRAGGRGGGGHLRGMACSGQGAGHRGGGGSR